MAACSICRRVHGCDWSGEYCPECYGLIHEADPTPSITVVRLGHFAGGSFGIPGNPSESHLYWTVKGPFNNGDFPKPAYTFLSQIQAEQCAAQEREKADALTLARIAEVKKKLSGGNASS